MTNYARHKLAALIIAAVLLLIGAAFLGDVLNVTGGGEGPRSTSNELAGRTVPPGTLAKCRRVARVEGMTISSTWRSASHNAEVGGVQNSMHLAGSLSNPGACDFSGSVAQYQRGAALGKRLGATEILIHAVPGGGGLHLHLGWVR